METAQAYAADISLIAYCMRKDEAAPILGFAVLDDLRDAAARLDARGIDHREVGRFVIEVLNAVRFAAPDATDPERERACDDRNVAHDIGRLAGAATPLMRRPPFASK